MERAQVRKAAAAEKLSVVHTVVLAFAADPMARWCWRDAHQYLANMPAFVAAFGGGAFQSNSVHCTSDCTGAALWLPPGAHPDEEAMARIVENSVPESIRSEVYAVIEQMSMHHPREPYWYLPMIGVDPAHQGKGYGSALLTHALKEIERDECLAYLESSNPRNIALYERHGFRAIGEIQVGTSPRMVPMLRTAGSGRR